MDKMNGVTPGHDCGSLFCYIWLYAKIVGRFSEAVEHSRNSCTGGGALRIKEVIPLPFIIPILTAHSITGTAPIAGKLPDCRAALCSIAALILRVAVENRRKLFTGNGFVRAKSTVAIASHCTALLRLGLVP